MKTFNKYLLEKLILNKNIKKSEGISSIDPKIQNKIENLMWEKSPGASYTHVDKMNGYKSKGSDPKRLVSKITNKTKLINRWWVAVTMQWNEAIKEFGNAIENKTDITLENLHQFVIKKLKNNSHKDAYNNYLALYNIKPNETNS